MEYNVRITETRVMLVPVEAESMLAAKLAAESNWRNNRYADNKAYTKTLTCETLYPDYEPLEKASFKWKTYQGGSGIAAEPTRKARRHEPGL